ncbi:MAG: DUF4365 domain-containing protein [Fretibacterium sp.]|nr:DUF4365 domain-containing protein [Fretibacterium sp.]
MDDMAEGQTVSGGSPYGGRQFVPGWEEVPNGERMGIYTASRLTARLPDLIFREQRSGDTGLNAHLEVVEEYPKMGKMVGLQVRSESGSEIERTARGYVCRGEMAHVAYWLQHSLPVIVMVYERGQDRLLWEAVTPETIEISGQHWELLVPYDQIYGEESVGRIADLSCYSPYLARLALDRPWMQIIEMGRGILLEMDEWLNQPSARGSLRLSVLSENGEKESVYEWPFQTNPDMPHVFRLASLFPWANIELDSDFYREKTGAETIPNSLAPWTVEAGEIARFRLRLLLNELGRSFLTTELFLRRGEFPLTDFSGGLGTEYEKGIKFQLYKKQ